MQSYDIIETQFVVTTLFAIASGFALMISVILDKLVRVIRRCMEVC